MCLLKQSTTRFSVNSVKYYSPLEQRNLYGILTFAWLLRKPLKQSCDIDRGPVSRSWAGFRHRQPKVCVCIWLLCYPQLFSFLRQWTFHSNIIFNPRKNLQEQAEFKNKTTKNKLFKRENPRMWSHAELKKQNKAAELWGPERGSHLIWRWIAAGPGLGEPEIAPAGCRKQRWWCWWQWW